MARSWTSSFWTGTRVCATAPCAWITIGWRTTTPKECWTLRPAMPTTSSLTVGTTPRVISRLVSIASVSVRPSVAARSAVMTAVAEVAEPVPATRSVSTGFVKADLASWETLVSRASTVNPDCASCRTPERCAPSTATTVSARRPSPASPCPSEVVAS